MGVFEYHQSSAKRYSHTIKGAPFIYRYFFFQSYHFRKEGFSLRRPSWVYIIQQFIDLHLRIIYNEFHWGILIYFSQLFYLYVLNQQYMYIYVNPLYNITYMYIFMHSNFLTVVNKYKTSLIVISWKLCI